MESTDFLFRILNLSCSAFNVKCVETAHWFTCLINKDVPHLFDRIFPESLRWLLATQQYGRSKWIMGHIAKKNRVNMELDADNILTGNKYIKTNFKEISIKSLFFPILML